MLMCQFILQLCPQSHFQIAQCGFALTGSEGVFPLPHLYLFNGKLQKDDKDSLHDLSSHIDRMHTAALMPD